jgi:hypothetical protein
MFRRDDWFAVDFGSIAMTRTIVWVTAALCAFIGTACEANPLFATAGCYFPNGTRVAYFANPPLFYQYIKVGSKLDIVVTNGNPATYSCTGGQGVVSGDLSMTVTQIDQLTNDPFAKFVLTGNH